MCVCKISHLTVFTHFLVSCSNRLNVADCAKTDTDEVLEAIEIVTRPFAWLGLDVGDKYPSLFLMLIK